MKAIFLINGNQVEIEGTPAELSEMLLGIPSTDQRPKTRSRKPAPQPPDQEPDQDNPNESIPPLAPGERISYANTYHLALGTSLKDYISKNPQISTDSFVIDITNKCRAVHHEPPPEQRLRKTIEAAKQMLQSIPQQQQDQDQLFSNQRK